MSPVAEAAGRHFAVYIAGSGVILPAVLNTCARNAARASCACAGRSIDRQKKVRRVFPLCQIRRSGGCTGSAHVPLAFGAIQSFVAALGCPSPPAILISQRFNLPTATQPGHPFRLHLPTWTLPRLDIGTPHLAAVSSLASSLLPARRPATMLPLSVRRVASSATQTNLASALGCSAPRNCAAKSLLPGHQRRYSSSKSSRPDSESSDIPAGQSVTTSTSRSGTEKRKRKSKDVSANGASFKRLPSVPSTHHISQEGLS